MQFLLVLSLGAQFGISAERRADNEDFLNKLLMGTFVPKYDNNQRMDNITQLGILQAVIFT